MKKTKLLRLLQSLHEHEWKALANFLASPYYNQEEAIQTLFLTMEHWLKTATLARKKRAELALVIWPDQAYDAKKLTYLMSRLNKLVEHFLGLEKLASEVFTMPLAQLEVFSERQLVKHYAATKRVIRRKLQQPTGSSANFLRDKARYTEILDQHHVRQNRRVFDSSIQQAAIELDKYYYLQRLQFACSMLDRQHILDSVYELDLSPAWIKHLESSQAVQVPIIQLYLHIFQLLSEEADESHFIRLKDSLVHHADDILSEDLTEIYQFAINYCARKIRQGQEAYVKEALQLYREGIASGFLIVNGQLSPWTYANVCKLYLRQKEYAAAHQFIEAYLPYLPEGFRQNAYHYNLAELYYYTQQAAKAQSHLIKVAYTDLNYYLGARVLLAKLYYETEAEDALSSLLAAFIMFLKRNKKLSKDIKQTYLNFCKILAQILRTNPSKRDTIRTTINTTPLLTDRQWLLEVCEHAL